MASFIIKPKNDDHLKLQNDAGNDIVEIKNDDKVLYVSRDSVNAEVALESYHDTEGTTPKLTMRKSDGSAASPALVDNNAVLGTISFQGHDGTNFEEGARIEARVDGTAASNDLPTELTFWTTPDGTNAAVERVVIDDAGNVTVKRDSANAEVALESYHDTEATTPKLAMKKSDGSIASPALVDDNAVLGTISFQGHDGTNFEEGARIEARVDGTAASNDMPTELTFWTTPDGSATAAQRVAIDDAGNLGVGIGGGYLGSVSSSAGTVVTIADLSGSSRAALEIAAQVTANTDLVAILNFINNDNSNAGASTDKKVAQIYSHIITSDSNAGDDSGGEIIFRTKPEAGTLTERIRILSGGGLTFNGDTAAANALDDYEEGTWTASFASGSGSLPAKSGADLMRYTKIGQVVFVQGYLGVDTGGSAPSAGDWVTVTGLPFAINNNTSGESSAQGSSAVMCAGVNALNGTCFAVLEPGQSYFWLQDFSSTGSTNMADHLKANSEFKIALVYTT